MDNLCSEYSSSASYNFLCKASFCWCVLSLIFLILSCLYKVFRILYLNWKADDFEFVPELQCRVRNAVNRTICRWITNSNCLNLIIFCLFIFFAVFSTSLLYVIDAVALKLMKPGNTGHLIYYTLMEIPVNIFQCCPFFMVMFALEVTRIKSFKDLSPRQSLIQDLYSESERRTLIRDILKKSTRITGILFIFLQSFALYAELNGKVLDDTSTIYSVFKILYYTILFATSVSLLSFLYHEKNAQTISIEISRSMHKDQLIVKFLQDQELDRASVLQIADILCKKRSTCQKCSQGNFYCFHALEKAIESKITMNFERLKHQVKNTENDSSLPLLTNPRSVAIWLKIPIVLITITYFVLGVCAVSDFLLMACNVKSRLDIRFLGWLRTSFEIINMAIISITIPILISERNLFGDPLEYTSELFQIRSSRYTESENVYSLMVEENSLF